MRLERFLLILALLLSPCAFGDVLLPGYGHIGDNDSTALRPTQVLWPSGGHYQTLRPINFRLTHPVMLKEIRLEGSSDLQAGMNVIIWDRYGNTLLDLQGYDGSRDRVTVANELSLPAGEYRIAVWGSCFYNNGNAYQRYAYPCHDWDDFTFSAIRLVTNGTSTAFHFSQRTHIGDNQDASRWYPPAASGAYVRYTFTLNKRSRLDSLSLFNLQDWEATGGSRIFIRTADSAYTPLVYYFTRNGDIEWKINYELAAGTYELWVESVAAYDRDDISWDSMLLTYTPLNESVALDNVCSIFPYPAQGRASAHKLDLSGNPGNTMGLVYGTQGGRLGYGPNGQIKGTSGSNCDGGLCVAVGDVAPWGGAPVSRFPLATGADVTLGFAETRYLTAADGMTFGTVSTSYQSLLNIENSGITIKAMNLGSGRGGRPYTVKLAAGDYWIETLTMSNDTSIEIDGPVRLFVKTLVMGSASYINSPGRNSAGDVGKLMVVLYDGATLTDGSTLSGLVYQADSARGSVSLSSASYLMGRINAQSVLLGKDSTIDSRAYQCSTVVAPDHYELIYSAQALTCEQASVQLRACKDSSCSQLFDAGASVSLSPQAGWSSNPVSLGSSGLANLTLARLTVGSVTLGASASAPAAPLRCYRDGVLDPGCTLDFVDAALRFNVPTFYAGESASSEIRAIKSSAAGATRVCLPLLTGTQSLRFDYGKVVSDPSQAQPTVNGTPLSAAGAAANVTFDANGVGQLTVQYPDAGVLRLDASVQRSDSTGTLNLKGSDTFAVLPKAIVLQGEGQSLCSGSDDASYAACPVYRRAGEGFNLLAQAINSANVATAGFATQGRTVDWQLLAPAGGVRGLLSPATLSMAAGSGRLATSWSEVGVIRAGVTDFVPYPNYQDESPPLTVPLRWSAPIGRFVPWDFAVSDKRILPACSSFTYTGQPFTSGFTVTARNLSAGTTLNYRGPFAKGASKLVAENGDLGGGLTSRIDQEPVLTWGQGIAQVRPDSPNSRLARSQALEESLMQLAVGLRIADGETPVVTRVAALDMRADEAGDCAPSGRCDAVRLGIQVLRHGRLAVSTEQGSAGTPLALRQQVESYQDGRWRPNVDDSCTELDLSGYEFTADGQAYDAGSGMLSFPPAGAIRLGLGSQAPGSARARVAAGETRLQLGAPGTPLTVPYRVDLSRQPGAPLWLLDDPRSLQGIAIFGSARGSDRIIYRRERFN
ncbi:DUF6701 domain-containing protein [Aeromonas diversa]|uniref:DUF6701 domain-containing protein n=1 Tax=Aeromonas diversa TaxID=502790 RepID=UPI003463495C